MPAEDIERSIAFRAGSGVRSARDVADPVVFYMLREYWTDSARRRRSFAGFLDHDRFEPYPSEA
ncbi:MAG: hypothetical protein AB7S70_15065 [Hyphomicrobium sp.]